MCLLGCTINSIQLNLNLASLPSHVSRNIFKLYGPQINRIASHLTMQVPSQNRVYVPIWLMIVVSPKETRCNDKQHPI